MKMPGKRKVRVDVSIDAVANESMAELVEAGFGKSAIFEMGIERAHQALSSRKKFAHRTKTVLAFRCQTQRQGVLWRVDRGKYQDYEPVWIYSIKKLKANVAEVTYYETQFAQKKTTKKVFLDKIDRIIQGKFVIKYKEEYK